MSVAQTVPDLFNKTREQWLEGARHAARQLLQTKRLITIEDVLAVYPRPKYLHKNITGRVFQTEMFHPVGFTLSKRALSHKRVIRLWTLSNAYRSGVQDEYDDQ